MAVDSLTKAAGEDFSFNNSHFKGGASKADVLRMRDEAKKEISNRKTARVNPKKSLSDGVDAEYVATIVKNSLAADLSTMGDQIKDIGVSLFNSQNLFQKNMQDILRNFQTEIANLITTPCTRIHVPQPDQTHTDNTGAGSIPSGNTNPCVPSDIIEEAMQFANVEVLPPRTVFFEKYLACFIFCAQMNDAHLFSRQPRKMLVMEKRVIAARR